MLNWIYFFGNFWEILGYFFIGHTDWEYKWGIQSTNLLIILLKMSRNVPKRQMCRTTSVTRLGYFWKFCAPIIVTKLPHLFILIWYLLVTSVWEKIFSGLCWATFLKIGLLFLKMGLFYNLFSVFSNINHNNFYNKYMSSSVPWNRTHNLWNMSLLT